VKHEPPGMVVPVNTYDEQFDA